DQLAADILRQVLAEEGPHLVAKGDFLGCETKVHCFLPSGGSVVVRCSSVDPERQQFTTDEQRTTTDSSVDLAPPGPAHAAADPHGDHRVSDAAPLALDQRMAGKARPAHAVGMAERDGPTVDVEPGRVDAEPVAAVDHLHGEGLVELPQADVV